MRPTFHPLVVQDVRRETNDCVSIAFQVPDELREKYQFKPGQYLTLRATVQGEDIRRSYSICSAPHDGELRVAIKRVEQGQFSTWATREVAVGDTMQVMTPTGTFSSDIQAERRQTYLMIAAGSGITPILSLTKTILKTESRSEVILLFGNRLFNSIIFRDELERLKDSHIGRLRVFHVLSGEPNEIPLYSGRINAEKLQQFAKTFIDVTLVHEAFLCGPEDLIRTSREFLVSAGMDETAIHFELFASPNARKVQSTADESAKAETSTAEKCAVTMIYDGYESHFFMPMDGTSILDAAQNTGMDIPFSCKGGMCCTCRAHLSDGKAEMKVNYALEPGEVEAGFVLTCQAVPTSSEVTVDFDRH
ncbi:MAG: 1,2-phenylacetyl-CoA epoxidase subunit PaaE [Flavobacteriales bacterium]